MTLGLLSACVAKGYLDSFDRVLFGWAEGLRSYRIDGIVKAITFFGSSTWVVIGLLFISVFERRKHGAVSAWIVLLSFAIVMVVELVLRFSVSHVRPDMLAPLESSSMVERFEIYGFPSGHGVRSAFVFGWILLRLKSLKPKRNLALGFLLISLIMSVGFSRVYLGRHWPSDILGSWLVVLMVFSIAQMWEMEVASSALKSKKVKDLLNI